MKETTSSPLEGIPHWIVKGGISCVLLAAIVAAGFGILWLFDYAAPISVPLLLAFVIGIITFPLVKIGDRVRFPRALSSFVIILLVVATLWGAVQITIAGVVSEAPNISNQLIGSIRDIGYQFNESLTSLGFSQEQIDSAVAGATKTIQNTLEPASVSSNADGLLKTVISGIGSIKGAVTSVVSTIFGTLIAAMILFYLLSDYERIEIWVGTHLGVGPQLGVELVGDATSSLRDYFKGVTIKGAVTAAGTGISLAIFGVPLVIPIVIVTFITGYIPFFGAWIAISFAVLIAFGTKGLTVAIIVLILCLVVQNVIEPLVNAHVVGEKLNLHPIVVLGVTILGSTLAGLMGATLAVPTVSMALKINARLKTARQKAADAHAVAIEIPDASMPNPLRDLWRKIRGVAKSEE